MKKAKGRDPDKPYTGVKMFMKSNGIKIVDVYNDLRDQTDVDISLSSFYNFCRGKHFTRSPELINWMAGRLGITSEAFLGFYKAKGPNEY